MAKRRGHTKVVGGTKGSHMKKKHKGGRKGRRHKR